MANQKFKDTLLSVLKADERLWQDGEFNQTRLFDLADKHDAVLLKLLIDNEELKEKFFVKVNDIFIFKGQDFKFFLDENKLDNSYTQFENIIGLKVGNKILKDRDEVVLNFPFKDCVLQGGQSRDEGLDIGYEYDEKLDDYVEVEIKRKEVFFNEILAKDEIDRLEAAKVLKNWKRYTKDGIVPVGSLKRDEDGVIKENLIIKGNNLLAMHSIKKEFAGKVKLIYIDPPYNTGSDTFKYNDNFNHSTWLTFMKNRLEVAYELLRNDDGVIVISLSDAEAHYCKVLMDGIFGMNNFLADVIWNSTKSVTNTAIISDSHTHNLCYFKNKDYYVRNRTEFRLPEDGEGFSNPDNDPRGPWKADPFQVGGWRPNQQYEIVNPKTGTVYKPNAGGSWKNDYTQFQKLIADNRIVFGVNGDAGPQRKRFLSEAEERGKVSKTLWTDLATTTNGTQHLKDLFEDKVFDNPKPEELIERIINLSTSKGDIVLDYHLGSGTTATVAHKMGRQYIGIEQMDYIEPVSVQRMKKVIAGEQGGISKAINWQGGGEFVYFELAEWNEGAKQKIQNANSIEELESLFDTMYERYFLNYNVKVKEFKEKVLTDAKFRSLPLDRQKDMFIRMLDLNQMYVNFTERNDKKFGISGDDISLSEEFYKN